MMPLHRRHVAGKTEAPSKDIDHDQEETKKMSDDSMAYFGPTNSRRSSLVLIGLVALETIAQLLVLRKTRVRSVSYLIMIMMSTFVSTLPMLLLLAVGLGLSNNSANDLPHQRYIPIIVASTIFAGQLPIFLSYGVASAGITIFGLSSRPIKENRVESKGSHSQSNGRKMSGQLKAVLAVLAMIGVLLTENFFIWVVSATYAPSQDIKTLPSPLQDNGQIALRYIFGSVLNLRKRDVVILRNMINVEAILVSGLGLSLVTIEVHGASIQRNLWSLAMRGVLTLAAARSIRTISFLMTVVPSQNPMCYFDHFPMPPKEWLPWLKVGLMPQVDGGCNDLIISGHATVTSTIACVVTSVVGKPLFTAAIWMFLTMDYLVEIYEGFHYSVDMFLGAMLVNFLWAVLSPLEDPAKLDQELAQRKFHNLQDSTLSDVFRYTLPAFGTWIQLVGIIPHSFATYSCIIYTVIVIFQISRFGFQQYTQHCLFCLLFMALGLFL